MTLHQSKAVARPGPSRLRKLFLIECKQLAVHALLLLSGNLSLLIIAGTSAGSGSGNNICASRRKLNKVWYLISELPRIGTGANHNLMRFKNHFVGLYRLVGGFLLDLQGAPLFLPLRERHSGHQKRNANITLRWVHVEGAIEKHKWAIASQSAHCISYSYQVIKTRIKMWTVPQKL